MNKNIIKPAVIIVFLTAAFVTLLIFFQNVAIGQSTSSDGAANLNPSEEELLLKNIQGVYSGGTYKPGTIPGLEITEEQRQNLDRLVKMPTGNMNLNAWAKISSQMSCLVKRNQAKGNKIDESQMADVLKSFNVTFEEYAAYAWQLFTGTLDKSKIEEINNMSGDAFMEKMNKDYEELVKNNCKSKNRKKDGGGGISSTSTPKITDETWLEITARIKCLDRILLTFTKYEIGKIFDPFNVKPAEYQAYSENVVKRMDEALKKDANDWTQDDVALAKLSQRLKQRIEDLKKNNCVLEDGKPISEEYDATTTQEWWDKIKCKSFSCDNCYTVSTSSSFWERYRCGSLCSGCPVVVPPPPPVTNCSGFCSINSCPSYADKIEGTCAMQKECSKCGPLKIFKCCKEKEAVCCKAKPIEICALKNCPTGMVPGGSKVCPSGTEKYKCGLFKLFTCKRNVSGVCCIPQ